MSDLATWQTQMAEGLIAGCYGALADAVLIGPINAYAALDIHRANALGGLVKALRLSLPTVEILVGEAFFEQSALTFAQARPPTSPWLTRYGAEFPAFLADYEGARALPYLPDVARLDLAIEAVGQDALGRDGATLDLGSAVITLDASLRVLALAYPAVDIRDAVEADDEALAALDVTPRPQVVALWRSADGASLQSLSPLAAAFLCAVLTGGDIEAALSSGGDLADLQSDVFSAPFVRLTLKEPAQ
jgi:hypothetical protein